MAYLPFDTRLNKNDFRSRINHVILYKMLYRLTDEPNAPLMTYDQVLARLESMSKILSFNLSCISNQLILNEYRIHEDCLIKIVEDRKRYPEQKTHPNTKSASKT